MTRQDNSIIASSPEEAAILQMLLESTNINFRTEETYLPMMEIENDTDMTDEELAEIKRETKQAEQQRFLELENIRKETGKRQKDWVDLDESDLDYWAMMFHLADSQLARLDEIEQEFYALQKRIKSVDHGVEIISRYQELTAEYEALIQ